MREVITEPADLLIVAGDMTFGGEKKELEWFEDWLIRQPQTFKVWIAGNHEVGLEKYPKWAAEIARRSGSFYLEDSSVEIEGIKLWGSPVTPYFYDWAFKKHRGDEIRETWKQIPDGTDILITHGPPNGFLDQVPNGEHVGCEVLAEFLQENFFEPPQVHVFGHIHSGYGEAQLKRSDGHTIHLINASSCDQQYRPSNPPIRFQITARSQMHLL